MKLRHSRFYILLSSEPYSAAYYSIGEQVINQVDPRPYKIMFEASELQLRFKLGAISARMYEQIENEL
jgi:hypothetical protein